MSNKIESKKSWKPISLLDSSPRTLPSENLRFVSTNQNFAPSSSYPTQPIQTSLQTQEFDLQQYYDNLRATADCVQSLVTGDVTASDPANLRWSEPAQNVEFVRQSQPNMNPDQVSQSNSTMNSNNVVSNTETSNATDSNSNFEQESMSNDSNAGEGSLVVNPGAEWENSLNFLSPLQPLWFYKVSEKKSTDKNSSVSPRFESRRSGKSGKAQLEDENWLPFSIFDSTKLESAYFSLNENPNIIVSTDGGRYDCDVLNRTRRAIYWKEEPYTIRRCTWFYKKEGYVRYVPYPEDVADELETICSDVVKNGRWNQRIEFSDRSKGCLIFYNLNAIMHYDSIDDVIKDDSNLIVGNPHNPRILKRNLTLIEMKLYDETDYDLEESGEIDHLVFLVHGIGEFCDMRFRTIREVVDDFRKISLQLIREHFKNNNDKNRNVGRIEFLPIFWHDAVHGQQTGNDEQLRLITLPSIPKLRNFTNDTILDALFYTSPVYCQMIVNTVAVELNRLHSLFLSRNPTFKGTVAVSGHSLGSLILFDILANQPTTAPTDAASTSSGQSTPSNTTSMSLLQSTTGQPLVQYPSINFEPSCFFALGSPIAMFLTIRGVKNICLDFRLPTCRKMYNLFHPFDPVAYRIEPLINRDYAQLQPIILPHHKGRKRMHIQIKENLMKVSTDIKEKVMSSIRQTWNSVNSIVRLGKQEETAGAIQAAPESGVLPNEPKASRSQATTEEQMIVDQTTAVKQSSTFEDEFEEEENSQSRIDAKRPIGRLNDGERIDFVLQEKPIEYINEYIFALATHACYWQSEDTCLFILKELYKLNGIRPNAIRPSQTFNYMPFASIPMITQFGYASSAPSTSNHPSQSSSSPTNQSTSSPDKDEAVIDFR